MNKRRVLDYKDVSLVPRVVSTLKSRSEADTGINCFGIHLDVPIIASPMPDVCDGEMAYSLSELGALGIIHRFQSIDQQVEEYMTRHHINQHVHANQEHYRKNIACAIGIGVDYQERFKALYTVGCRIFCLDTANGANEMVGEAVNWIRKYDDEIYTINKFDETRGIFATCPKSLREKVYIIAGNVASKQGYQYLAQLGVDAVRVGIAGGCFTPNMGVITDNGIKKIKDIKLGDRVYSHDESLNIVENKFEFDRNEEIIVINDIECTKNHEFYVVEVKYENIVTDENIKQYAKFVTAETIFSNPDIYLLVDIAGGSNEQMQNVQ